MTRLNAAIDSIAVRAAENRERVLKRRKFQTRELVERFRDDRVRLIDWLGDPVRRRSFETIEQAIKYHSWKRGVCLAIIRENHWTKPSAQSRILNHTYRLIVARYFRRADYRTAQSATEGERRYG